MPQTLAPGKPITTWLKLAPWDAFGDSVPVDYHMHTSHTDGTSPADEMARAAVSQGIDQILFSEHVRHTSTYYPEFVSEIRALRFPELTIGVGIETKVLSLEGHLDCSPEIADICDAIVGSVHNMPPDATGAVSSWADLDVSTAVDLEFEFAMAIVTKSRAHILAHPMGMSVTRLKAKPLEQLSKLAIACRERGKAFELNTRYCSDPEEWIEIVRQAGCNVSFGSDAHRAQDVGSAWHLFKGFSQNGTLRQP